MAVYLVGGPVRDALLARPVMDLDFSVEGDAMALGAMVARRLGGECTGHRRFGTATVQAGDIRIDLVTARRETYPGPGRLPEVVPGGIADDLARRDFTINAMALPVWPREGGLIDPMGGLNDLETGILRVLHPRSFIDDPTRMFRAVRYEQRFGFRIDDPTVELMASAISARHMDAVSGDRWRHEIDRILDESAPGPALLRASDLGLLAGLHPALANSQGLLGLTTCAGDAPVADEWLAALFSPLSVSEGDAVIRRLRLPGRRAAVARDTIDLRDIEPEVMSASRRSSDLCRLLSRYDHSAIGMWAKLATDAPLKEALRQYLDELRYVHPSLSGDDLLGLEVPQGPMIGRILARIRDAKLDGEVSNVEEERALARALLARCLKGATK